MEPRDLPSDQAKASEATQDGGSRSRWYVPTGPLTEEERAKGAALWQKIQRMRELGTGGYEESISLEEIGPGYAP